VSAAVGRGGRPRIAAPRAGRGLCINGQARFPCSSHRYRLVSLGGLAAAHRRDLRHVPRAGVALGRALGGVRAARIPGGGGGIGLNTVRQLGPANSALSSHTVECVGVPSFVHIHGLFFRVTSRCLLVAPPGPPAPPQTSAASSGRTARRRLAGGCRCAAGGLSCAGSLLWSLYPPWLGDERPVHLLRRRRHHDHGNHADLPGLFLLVGASPVALFAAAAAAVYMDGRGAACWPWAAGGVLGVGVSGPGRGRSRGCVSSPPWYRSIVTT